MDLLRNNRFALHILLGMVLTLVYPMQELFSGNQNIYFLWGMGRLMPHAFAADPLLLSPDPYPLFSWLISLVPVQFLSSWTTAIYVLLNSVYSFSLFGMANRLTPLYGHRKQLAYFTALFLFVHTAPIWGTYFQLVFNADLRWMWDSGIAEQGVLRGYLQPSVFGVFLLLSLYQAMERNYAVALLCIAPAATMHASYLFLGGILASIFLLRSNFGKKDLLAAGVLLLLVLPYSYYILTHFIQVQESVKDAVNTAVMAGFDENIHINPHHWFNAKFYMQLTILLAGMAALWQSPLRNMILGLVAIGTFLTVLAYGVGNTTLISLNPWRVSILIMPVATVAILSKIASNGMWSAIRPHTLSAIGIIACAILFYRLFGTSSADFVHSWKMVQIVAFILVLLAAGFLFRIELLNRFLDPLVMLTLIAVGLADHHVDGITKMGLEEFKAIAAIGKAEEPTTVYIIPPEWTSFRMNAGKSVFVDKNLVYGPALPSLVARLQLVADLAHGKDPKRILQTLPADVGVKWITTDLGQKGEQLTDSYTCVTLR